MKNIKSIIVLSCCILGVFSCTDLDVKPKGSATSDVLLTTPEGYKQFMAKLYAGLTTTGQNGPAAPGDRPDLRDIRTGDEGFSQYMRGLWNMETLSTDEAVTSWGDIGLKDYHQQNWTSQSPFITQFYYRIFYQIALANLFIREIAPTKLTERGLPASFTATADSYRAEARFLRAMAYWHGLNYFRNIPFVDENSSSSAKPPQATPQQIFDFVEAELKEIETILPEPRANQYGRVDRAAAWIVLAKLYLNAEVYLGQDRYTDCITYCKKIMAAGYTLEPVYQHLFLTDNNETTEIIFGVPHDGLKTQSFGGVSLIINGACGGTLANQVTNGRNSIIGNNANWAGHRTTKSIVNLFPDTDGEADTRALFWTDGQELEIEDVNDFRDGIIVTKYRNVNRDGQPGQDPQFTDTDFPLFRLADVYLMFAEAVVRGGDGASMDDAVEAVNLIRERAYPEYPAEGQIDASDLTLNFLLDERARELYWEGQRRTDMVRFGVFTDNPTNNPRGVWPWKGGVKDGKATESFRNIFPIPATEIIANTNLTQNDDY
ncbi:RagB/SusD family nutrient uptake outer membrane protein [Pseudochryseolinea flava]|uniref:RagB/SusD family nutrient uptake outer membrane protein n=1 Tax=Pseudochryseolinea flava TaxID=2059302 RepID=A0A364Y5K8_9BACT|nr:RagB/SusD family nutrient uptake outer membrane protein [Pseudochryseolinea flava]RAW01468.1 RagB/SusD family nutrient uptake outer membrane protein [Pseudochryseolinea flava]